MAHTRTETVLRHLGLTRRQAVPRDLVESVRRGLPARGVRRFLDRYGVTIDELDRDLRLPKSTLSRVFQGRGRFSPAQSDKIRRLVETFARAAEVFESEENALRWLRTANRALGGDRPLELLDTEAGGRLVEEVLGRIEQGVYS